MAATKNTSLEQDTIAPYAPTTIFAKGAWMHPNRRPLIYRLIDSLDTLAVLGNYSEFRRVYQHIADTSTFDADINVSVFETNIREGY